jgi:hypothetical protein
MAVRTYFPTASITPFAVPQEGMVGHFTFFLNASSYVTVREVIPSCTWGVSGEARASGCTVIHIGDHAKMSKYPSGRYARNSEDMRRALLNSS